MLELASEMDKSQWHWTPLIQQQVVCLREHRAEEEGVDIVKLNNRLFASTHADDVWGQARAR
jgi:hypothetical protein